MKPLKDVPLDKFVCVVQRFCLKSLHFKIFEVGHFEMNTMYFLLLASCIRYSCMVYSLVGYSFNSLKPLLKPNPAIKNIQNYMQFPEVTRTLNKLNGKIYKKDTQKSCGKVRPSRLVTKPEVKQLQQIKRSSNSTTFITNYIY